MTRRMLTLPCDGDVLAATLDEGAANVGLLIVSGGNETRAGAFGGQAAIAARLAEHGYPVLRFDRRGTGDSTGLNEHFRCSADDVAAALAALRREGEVTSVVAWGNCDGASALMLRSGVGCDALVLSNPWTYDDDGEDGATASDEDPLPPETIRQRYAERLRDPRQILRLLRGEISLRKLARGLISALRPAPPPSTLADDIAQGLSGFSGPVRILLATGDRTAQAFASHWPEADTRIIRNADADHGFSGNAQDWVVEQLVDALEEARQLDMR